MCAGCAVPANSAAYFPLSCLNFRALGAYGGAGGGDALAHANLQAVVSKHLENPISYARRWALPVVLPHMRMLFSRGLPAWSNPCSLIRKL